MEDTERGCVFLRFRCPGPYSDIFIRGTDTIQTGVYSIIISYTDETRKQAINEIDTTPYLQVRGRNMFCRRMTQLYRS